MIKGHAYMLVAYTCARQMSKGRAYPLVACLQLVAYTCGGQMSKGCAYMLVGIHLWWANV